MMTYFLLDNGLMSPLNLLSCNDFGKVYCKMHITIQPSDGGLLKGMSA